MKSNKLSLGILASVDAGKTTLSESILYRCGIIRRRGKVDSGDAFLDNDAIEKKRGITIFSKEARIKIKDMDVCLIDTPGHIEFSAEMERTLNVLDAAVLVVSSEGINIRTRQIWSKLEKYGIPRIVFVNKCDLDNFDEEKIRCSLAGISPAIIDYMSLLSIDKKVNEQIALSSETALEIFEKKSRFNEDDVLKLVNKAQLYPCIYGSALQNQGVDELLDALLYLNVEREYHDAFSCFVYKIKRDSKGTKLSHVKITGGNISVKQSINDEKINEIRLYNGEKYETVNEISAGEVCVLTGLEKTFSGQLIGQSKIAKLPEADMNIIRHRLILPEYADFHGACAKLRKIGEELPEINLQFINNEQIRVSVSGELHMQTISQIIERQLGYSVLFGDEEVNYLESIEGSVKGYGHFEPLRHYAEVHVELKSLPQGSGIRVKSICSENELAIGKQNTILNILQEVEHKGVLTGARLTDVEITLLHAREHIEHTEGGDFREAARRAVRQALMKSKSVILEPNYNFTITVKNEYFGKVNAYLTKISASIENHEIINEFVKIKGEVSVSEFRKYLKDISVFCDDGGNLELSLGGYSKCKYASKIIEASKYDPDADVYNPSFSIFMENGTGVIVNWQECEDMMHIKENLHAEDSRGNIYEDTVGRDFESLDDIFEHTYGKKTNTKTKYKKIIDSSRDDSKYKSKDFRKKKREDKTLLIDGYNVIYSSPELEQLAKLDFGAAREKLVEIVAEYTAVKNFTAVLVFDAYKNKDKSRCEEEIHGVNVVFTATNETADSYIEKYVFKNINNENITVVTSDRMEQMTVFQLGAERLSARDFFDDFELMKKQLGSFSYK